MPYVSPEDLKAAGFIREGDIGWEGFARVGTLFGAMAAGAAAGGPVGMLAAAAIVMKKVNDGRDRG